MKYSEFWARLEAELGTSMARHWAGQQVLAGLGQRTVLEALAAGESPKRVWRVVAASLEISDGPR